MSPSRGGGPALWRILRPSPLQVRDFSGGWNIRDAPSEIARNETPDCLNMSIDERGGAVKRLGLSRLNGSPLAGVAQVIFYWETGQVVILQIGTSVYKTSDMTTLTLIGTFSTVAAGAFCEFNGLLVAVHPVDGVITSNGSTWVVATVTVKGTACAVWQNKVWVTGDPVNKSRVWWSNAGSATTYTTATDFVDIREIDDAACTAIGVGQGMDIAGRPGLLVFKARSWYRINNSTTGSYTTLHAKAGAAGPRSVVDVNGLTAAISEAGIYLTDGVVQPKEMTPKIKPLFLDTQIDFTNLGLAAAGVKGDRMLFSLPRMMGGVAQASNNFTLEFHPTDGWIVPHGFGIGCFTSWGKQAGKLYGASPLAVNAFEVFKGFGDDGAAIAARYQTPWFEPAGGVKCSFLRLRVAGRGQFQVYVRRDYSLGLGDLRNVSITGNASVWGSSVWGGGLWGPTSYEGYEDFYSIGIARAISFVMQESSVASAFGPKLLADGAAPEVGAFACYGLDSRFVSLGDA